MAFYLFSDIQCCCWKVWCQCVFFFSYAFFFFLFDWVSKVFFLYLKVVLDLGVNFMGPSGSICPRYIICLSLYSFKSSFISDKFLWIMVQSRKFHCLVSSLGNLTTDILDLYHFLLNSFYIPISAFLSLPFFISILCQVLCFYDNFLLVI